MSALEPGHFDEPSFDEPSFDEPWQAQVFALAVALNRRGLLDWGQWVRAVAAQPKGAAYEDWLGALEKILVDRGIVSADGLHRLAVDWQAAAEATPHGKPVELRRSL